MKQPYASDSSVAVMSDEKSAGARGSEGAIDLAEIEKDALADLAHANIEASQTSETAHLVRALRYRARQKLALVRAVRAARAYIGSGHVADRLALDAALAPFTDSAESDKRGAQR